MRYFLSVVLIVFAGWAAAQSYPEPSDLSVNDFAGIIDDETEQRLVEKLDALRAETDVELVVLTLSRQEMFAPDLSLKDFARGIFDEWGIGDKKRDDGILVLVLRGDQAMRIALGKAYGKKADKASDKAVEQSFLPAFREDRYQQGIENGVTDLIENVVRPYVAKLDREDGDATGETETSDSIESASANESSASTGTTEATETTATQETASESQSATGSTTAEGESKGGMSWLLYILGGIAALVGFFVVKSKTRKCPGCGERGSLSTTTNTIEPATETSAGRGERITSCEKCDYRDVQSFDIPKREKEKTEPEPEPEEFSGGEAGKKGSTGKW